MGLRHGHWIHVDVFKKKKKSTISVHVIYWIERNDLDDGK